MDSASAPRCWRCQGWLNLLWHLCLDNTIFKESKLRRKTQLQTEISTPSNLFLVAIVLAHWCRGQCAALCCCRSGPWCQRGSCHENERSPPVPSCGWRSWGSRCAPGPSFSSGLKQKRGVQMHWELLKMTLSLGKRRAGCYPATGWSEGRVPGGWWRKKSPVHL